MSTALTVRLGAAFVSSYLGRSGVCGGWPRFRKAARAGSVNCSGDRFGGMFSVCGARWQHLYVASIRLRHPGVIA